MKNITCFINDSLLSYLESLFLAIKIYMMNLLFFILLSQETTTDNIISFIKELNDRGILEDQEVASGINRIIDESTFVNLIDETLTWTNPVLLVLYEQMEIFKDQKLNINKLRDHFQEYIKDRKIKTDQRNKTIDLTAVDIFDISFFDNFMGKQSFLEEDDDGLIEGLIKGDDKIARWMIKRLNSSEIYFRNKLLPRWSIDKLIDLVLKAGGFKNGIPWRLLLYSNYQFEDLSKLALSQLSTSEGIDDFFSIMRGSKNDESNTSSRMANIINFIREHGYLERLPIEILTEFDINPTTEELNIIGFDEIWKVICESALNHSSVNFKVLKRARHLLLRKANRMDLEHSNKGVKKLEELIRLAQKLGYSESLPPLMKYLLPIDTSCVTSLGQIVKF